MSLDSQSVRTPAAAVQAVVVVHCLHPHLALPVVPASSVRNPFQHQLHVLGPLVQASAPPAPLHPVLSADALHVDTARALIGEKVRASSLGALGLVAQQPVDRRGSKGREDSLSCWRMNGRSGGRGATPPPPPPSKESSEELYGELENSISLSSSLLQRSSSSEGSLEVELPPMPANTSIVLASHDAALQTAALSMGRAAAFLTSLPSRFRTSTAWDQRPATAAAPRPKPVPSPYEALTESRASLFSSDHPASQVSKDHLS